MIKEEISGLACKILSVFLIIQGVSAIANVLTYYITSPNIGNKYPGNIFFPLIFYVLLGILLWIFSNKLSKMMTKKESSDDSNENTKITPNDIQRISFSVLGLFFLVNSIPPIISGLTNYYAAHQFDSSIRWIPNVAGYATQFIIGLFILIGSQGLVNLLKAIRTAGVKEEHFEKRRIDD
ncbi:MAG: hypothetical protein GX434_17730 [Peptococcaceae bacterium]|nr:hypothetical protein [Peptococcaceae bacterium]